MKKNDSFYPVVLQHGLSHDSHVDAGIEIFDKLAMDLYIKWVHYDNSIGENEDIAKRAIQVAKTFFEQINKENI